MMLKTWENVRDMKYLIFPSDRGINLFTRGKQKQKKNPIIIICIHIFIKSNFCLRKLFQYWYKNSKETKGPINDIRRRNRKDISSFLKLRGAYPKAGDLYSSYGKIWIDFLHLQNQVHFSLSSCLLSIQVLC